MKIPKGNRHAYTFLKSLLSTIYCIFEVVSLGIVGHKRHICVTDVRKKKRKEKKMRSQDISFLSIIVLVALVTKNNNDDNNKYIRFLAR